MLPFGYDLYTKYKKKINFLLVLICIMYLTIRKNVPLIFRFIQSFRDFASYFGIKKFNYIQLIFGFSGCYY